MGLYESSQKVLVSTFNYYYFPHGSTYCVHPRISCCAIYLFNLLKILMKKIFISFFLFSVSLLLALALNKYFKLTLTLPLLTLGLGIVFSQKFFKRHRILQLFAINIGTLFALISFSSLPTRGDLWVLTFLHLRYMASQLLQTKNVMYFNSRYVYLYVS